MMAVTIKYSVGKNAHNCPDDVKAIQTALNRIKPCWGGPPEPFEATGYCGEKTLAAIRRFQRRHYCSYDGVITPGYRTLRKLNQVLDGRVDIVCVDVTKDNGFAMGAIAWSLEEVTAF